MWRGLLGWQAALEEDGERLSKTDLAFWRHSVGAKCYQYNFKAYSTCAVNTDMCSHMISRVFEHPRDTDTT